MMGRFIALATLLTAAPLTLALQCHGLRSMQPRVRAGPIKAGLINALRELRKVTQAEEIKIGGALPEVDVEVVLSEGLVEAAGVGPQASQKGAPDRATLSLKEAIGEQPTVLLGMPGAFTPSCTDLHLPGYINAEGRIESKGIEQIALMTTNDVHVNAAWLKVVEQCVGKQSKIALISDGDGDAVRALGLATDMGFGFSTRTKRFALVLDEGVVKHVAVDEGMIAVEKTSAETIEKVLPSVFPQSVAAQEDKEQQQGLVAVLLLAAASIAYYYKYYAPPM